MFKLYTTKRKEWGENPRTQWKLDLFAFYADISQRIDQNVSIQQIKHWTDCFVSDCQAKCVKEYFDGKPINTHHYKRSDVLWALSIQKHLLEMTYDSVDDYVSELVIMLSLLKVEAIYQDKTETALAVVIGVIVSSCMSMWLVDLNVWSGLGAICGSALCAYLYLRTLKRKRALLLTEQPI